MIVEYVVIRTGGRAEAIVDKASSWAEAHDRAERLCKASYYLTKYEACTLVYGPITLLKKGEPNSKDQAEEDHDTTG